MQKLSFERGVHTQMFWDTVPNDWSCNTEASFAELYGFSQHGQVTAFHGD